jgi:protoheme IX farnesyltransferase
LQPVKNNLINETVSYSKSTAYFKLTKFKLSALVVFSAVITYFSIAENFEAQKIVAIIVGGFLVTGAANGFNQIIEMDLDGLMSRTKFRPLPTANLSKKEAVLFCLILSFIGVIVLGRYCNVLSGIVGFLSIFIYALVYTPLKLKTPFSVFVGAFPGAFPTLIGAIAASDGFGEIHFFGVLLFLIQFAWVRHDDYQRAGFFMLPSKGGRDKSSRSLILIYTLALFPISLTPYFFGYTGWMQATLVSMMGLIFIFQSFQLYKSGTIEDARKLMYGSFIYLPLVQLALMTKF